MKKLKNFEKKKVSVSEKKIGSNTDTEIGHWFRFPIPQPCSTVAMQRAKNAMLNCIVRNGENCLYAYLELRFN